MPSCAMGCIIAKNTASITACYETCARAKGRCTFGPQQETGGLTFNQCADCWQGGGASAKNCRQFGVNDSTCTVQKYEAWALHRGCGDYGGQIAADCKQGCRLSFQCQAPGPY